MKRNSQKWLSILCISNDSSCSSLSISSFETCNGNGREAVAKAGQSMASTKPILANHVYCLDVVLYLHVIHHKLVTKMTAMLCVAYFFVHETVNERYAAVNRKGSGQLFIGPRKTRRISLVAQFCHTQDVVTVFDWEAENVSVQ